MKQSGQAEYTREFGKRVKERRKKERRTQGWCAAQVPCSTRTWQRVEEGLLPEEENARIKLENNVARVLGCTVAELRGERPHVEVIVDTKSQSRPLSALMERAELANEQLRDVIIRIVRIFPTFRGKPTPEAIQEWQRLLTYQTELIERAIFGEDIPEMSEEERVKALEAAMTIIMAEIEKAKTQE